VKTRHVEITILILNIAALILCISAADYIIVGLGVLAMLTSVGFNKLLGKFHKASKEFTSLSLAGTLIISSLPLVSALFFNFFYESAQGAQTIFIISSYMIGINIIALSSDKV
jgi:hypothetical protein